MVGAPLFLKASLGLGLAFRSLLFTGEGKQVAMAWGSGGTGADAWLAVALGLPLLLLACLYSYSKSLRLQAGRGSAQVPGDFWQLPLLGQSIQLLRASSPDDFMLPRMKRYGQIFRTHLFGRPAICISSVDATKLVLQSPKSFINAFPNAAKTLFGHDAIFHVEGDAHSRYRRLVQAPLVPEALKQFTLAVDNIASSCLQGWGPGTLVNTSDEAKRYTFLVGLKLACDHLSASVTDELLILFDHFEEGLLAVPVNLPGTNFYTALTARKRIADILEKVIEQRRAEKGLAHHNDLLDSFLNREKDSEKLEISQVVDNIITVLFAAHGTMQATITSIIRNFCLYPSMFQEIQAEHDAIAERRSSKDDPVTWDDLQHMPLSHRFLLETLRTSNVVSFVAKEAVEDFAYNGMLIPKGWQVLVWPRMFHLDSQYFPDPHKFDPSRFKTMPKANTFTPFGNGYRVCPGSELAKQEIMVFLHRFLLSYEFEAVGPIGTKIRYLPVAYPADGMPLRITKKRQNFTSSNKNI